MNLSSPKSLSFITLLLFSYPPRLLSCCAPCSTTCILCCVSDWVNLLWSLPSIINLQKFGQVKFFICHISNYGIQQLTLELGIGAYQKRYLHGDLIVISILGMPYILTNLLKFTWHLRTVSKLLFQCKRRYGIVPILLRPIITHILVPY